MFGYDISQCSSADIRSTYSEDDDSCNFWLLKKIDKKPIFVNLVPSTENTPETPEIQPDELDNDDVESGEQVSELYFLEISRIGSAHLNWMIK